MRSAAAGLAGLLALSLGPAVAAQGRTGELSCDAFIREFPAAATNHRTSFERPLTISRGFGEAGSGIDVRVLTSDTKVDGTLRCRGDAFVRFELRASLPADDRLLADFSALSRAALMAAFHWDRAKAETVDKAMSADAAEYLRASLQRGDLYNAGKVEYHQGDRLDLGLLFTETDHTFVISSQSDD